MRRQKRGWAAIRAWCVAWWHSGREDADDTEPEEEPSDAGYGTPVSVETPLQSSVSRYVLYIIKKNIHMSSFLSSDLAT